MTLLVHGRFGVAGAGGHGAASIDGPLSRKFRVEVDGDAYRGVLAADTWAGWVDVVRRDRHGNVLLRDGEPQVVRHHGRVVARLRHGTLAEVRHLTRAGLSFA